MVYKYWKNRFETMSMIEQSHWHVEFAKYINEYDKRRSKNFRTTFPELTTWI